MSFVLGNSNPTHRWFNTLNPQDLIEWDALFLPTYDLRAHRWRPGDTIFDTQGQLAATPANAQPAPDTTSLFWVGSKGTVARFPNVGITPVFAHRLVAVAQNVAGPGAYWIVISLGPADPGEFFYMNTGGGGAALVEAGLTPPNPGDPCACDADGRTKAPAPGDVVAGSALSPIVTLNGIEYQYVVTTGMVQKFV